MSELQTYTAVMADFSKQPVFPGKPPPHRLVAETTQSHARSRRPTRARSPHAPDPLPAGLQLNPWVPHISPRREGFLQAPAATRSKSCF